MGRLALIPAAPVLLPDIDASEAASAVRVRTAITDLLSTADLWALPVDALPAVLGLGGFGIDRGLDTRTGQRLDGDDWVNAVSGLAEDDRDTCTTAHPGLAVAALHAHAAEAAIGPLGSSDSVLVPIDLSAAASANAPLAPVPGARDFDSAFMAAVRTGDLNGLRDAVSRAGAVHADLELLGAALDHLGEEPHTGGTTVLIDETIHEVRTVCAVIGT